jgi:hypothetical protein
MGSASKSIDDDTEALAMLTTLLQYAAVLRFFHDCFFHTTSCAFGPQLENLHPPVP